MINQAFDSLGWLGVGVFAVAYALLQLGALKGNSYSYVLLNLVGAALVLAGAQGETDLSMAVLAGLWIPISLIGIGRLIWLNKRIRFTPDEEHLLKILFPKMEKALARKFLDAGKWYDLEPGAELTTEDQPVTHMTYLSSGSAMVSVKEKEIGAIKSGLIGEINVLNGGSATATVRLDKVSRALVFSGADLQRLSAKDHEFKMALENAMKLETGEKLRRANQRLAATSE